MKKICYILLMLSLLVGAATLYSCAETPNTGNGTENPTPDHPPPEPEPEPSLDAPEPLEHPNVPTPIAWGAYKAEPKVASDGVAIEVTSVENRNFVFSCRPGLRAKSFRLDVYPLSVLYNALMERMNTEGMPLTTPATPVEVEGWIREFLFAEGGNAGYTFAEEEPGYNNMVFD